MHITHAIIACIIVATSISSCSVQPDKIQNGRVTKPEQGAQIANNAEGKALVGLWDGLLDEIPSPARWRISTKEHINSVLPTTSPSPTTLPTVSPNQNSGASDIVFRIPRGTGSKPWNTANNPAVMYVGKKFTIINDDTVGHQWHTNGQPCPHGDYIPPGGQYSCTPKSEFSGQLYDHLNQESGFFYVQSKRQ